MDLQVEHDGANPVVRVVGDMDADTAYDVYLAVLEQSAAGATAVVLDLAGVEFIDSIGLGMLVRARDDLQREAGPRLRLRAPSARVTRMLELTALTSAFDIVAGA